MRFILIFSILLSAINPTDAGENVPMLRSSKNSSDKITNSTTKVSIQRRLGTSDAGVLRPDPERLFGCGEVHVFGHSYGMQLAQDVFPNIATKGQITKIMTNEEIIQSGATENDLLVFFMHSCHHLDPNLFPGQVIVVTGESKLGVHCLDDDPRKNKYGPGDLPGHCGSKQPTGPRIFHIGPEPDGPQNLRANWGILLLNARSRRDVYPRMDYDTIFNRNLIVPNTGEHFLLYANSHVVDFRQHAFDRLSEIEEVHYLALHGNDGVNEDRKKKSPLMMDRFDGSNKNSLIFHHYRFALVMENEGLEDDDGFITEKIFNAFLGGTVPIYFGTREIFNVINPNAFIWYNPLIPEAEEAALERIQFLEHNIDEYEKMLQQPILKDGERTIREYFSFEDNVGNGYLKRRIRSMMGYESPVYHFELLSDGIQENA